MKQLIFLMVISTAGGLGAIYQPFWGLLLYYFLAVLRPQYLWSWALPFEWRWSLFAGLIVIGTSLMNARRTLLGAQTNTIMWLAGIYGILFGISCLTAHNPAISEPWVIDAAKVLIMVILGSLIINQLWQVWLLVAATAAALGYIAFNINHMYFFQSGRLDIFHHGYGGLDNNGAGLFLAMGIPLAMCFIGMRYTAKRRWAFILAGMATLLIMHSVMMTYSRGAMLAAGVGVAWMVWNHRPRSQAVAGGVALVLLISVMAGPQIRERFMSTTDFQQDASAQSRLDSWSAGWKLAWVNPITGLGVRNSAMFVQNYGADKQGRTIHSVYLQIAADSGIPAAAVYMAILVISFFMLNRCRRMAANFAHRYSLQPNAPPRVDRIIDTQRLCIGIQGSLIIFACGAVFLSVEIFELQWLMCLLAGVMPVALGNAIRRAQAANHSTAAHPAEPTEPTDPQDPYRFPAPTVGA